MKLRFLLVVVLFLGFVPDPSTAVPAPTVQQGPNVVWNSQRQGILDEQRRQADAIRQVRDSLTMLYIGMPGPQRPNRFADSLRKVLIVENGDFMQWIAFANQLGEQGLADSEKAVREQWVILTIGLLFLFLGIVRVSFPNEVVSIIQAFYNDRMLTQINKEDTLYSSWPFIFLYILFGFVTGLFFYLYSLYYLPYNRTQGIDVFLGISLCIIVLFVLKIVVTRFLGFIFDLQRAVREYVSVLYLSYFNAALVFLPLALIVSLTPQQYVRWVIPIGFLGVLLLLLFRFIKTVDSALGSYRFSKFYLFMYLCCLEIAPVLILIKVLGHLR